MILIGHLDKQQTKEYEISTTISNFSRGRRGPLNDKAFVTAIIEMEEEA
jgi:hypothetical protein